MLVREVSLLTAGGKRLKLGIISNELFSTDVGRMGGFGWAVQQVSSCFCDDPALGVDTIILMGDSPPANTVLPHELHGSRVLWPNEAKLQRAIKLLHEKIDLLLTIDYRPNYNLFFNLLPRVPIVIWVRDPWDSQDRSRVATLKILGQESEEPQGVGGFDSHSLRRVGRLSRLVRRALLFATTSPHLMAKIPSSYGVSPEVVHLLPNIIDAPISINKASRPTVVFLARLDPTKRPWVFAALAERFPQVEFLFMGQSHFRGSGSWKPRNLSANVRMLGHVNEASKRELLCAAWLLVNTSIHEGLSVSFLEALACETPVVACVDPDSVVSRFGLFVGTYPGTGMEALPALESAVRELLSDSARRERLGREGREWVCSTHNRARFLEAFSNLSALAGIPAIRTNVEHT